KEGDGTVEYPAGCDGAVGVGATDPNDARSSYSNQNSSVKLTAPGDAVLSTWGGGNSAYLPMSGTSMAAPHVAGCAALIHAASPGLRGSQIQGLLQSTAVDLGRPGYDFSYGCGRLNCGAAL